MLGWLARLTLASGRSARAQCSIVLAVLAGSYFLALAEARADDISNAERSVVRVVVVARDAYGEPVDLGHGTGFAIAPGRILTNFHVVDPSTGSAPLVFVIGESAAAVRATVLYSDPARDLALLGVDEALPSLPIATGAVPEGAAVVALGFPGNVDRATVNSFAEYLAPRDAVRSQGNLANRRSIDGISAYLHTAPISHGNSGGPLLDECGRVVGVNSYTTVDGEGDASFGFAIAANELSAFLKSANQVVREDGSHCMTAAEKAAAENKRQQDEAAEQQRRDREQGEVSARAQRQAFLEAQHLDENWIAASFFAAMLGFIGFGAATVLFLKDRRRGAAFAVFTGAALTACAVGAFLNRPIALPPAEAAAAPQVANVSADQASAENNVPSAEPPEQGQPVTAEPVRLALSEPALNAASDPGDDAPWQADPVEDASNNIDYNEGL